MSAEDITLITDLGSPESKSTDDSVDQSHTQPASPNFETYTQASSPVLLDECGHESLALQSTLTQAALDSDMDAPPTLGTKYDSISHPTEPLPDVAQDNTRITSEDDGSKKTLVTSDSMPCSSPMASASPSASIPMPAKSPKRRASWVDSLGTFPAPQSVSTKGGIRVFCRVRPLNVAESHQQQQLFPTNAPAGVIKPPEVVEFVSNRQVDLIKPNALQTIIFQRQRQIQTGNTATAVAPSPTSADTHANLSASAIPGESAANSDDPQLNERTAEDVDDIPHDTTASYTSFHFDNVFTPLSSQQQCFAEVHETVLSALDGYNACIFAYGQTGSGKTHTMFGTPTEPGLTPRTIAALFDEIERRAPQLEYTVSASLVEIYNEQLRDLFGNLSGVSEQGATPASRTGVQFSRATNNDDLDTDADADLDDISSSSVVSPPGTTTTTGGNRLRIRPSRRGMYIDNCLKATCTTRSSLLALVEEGSGLRAVGSTLLNNQSTRSHVILQLTVDGVDVMTQVRTYGKVTLVDLAGSERVSAAGSQGQRLVEAAHINKSLSALGDVFLALSNRQEHMQSSQQSSQSSNQLQIQSHIPYRNSKLTYLLQDSIGGNSKTIMFVAVSPSYVHHSETLNSLMFARRVKSIKLDAATANVDTAQAQRFRHQLEQLRRRLDSQQQQSQKQIRALEKALEEKDSALSKIVNERNMKTQTTNAVIAQLTLELDELRRSISKEKREEAKSAKDKERNAKDRTRAEAAERQVRELTSQRDALSTRVAQLEADVLRNERELQRRNEERENFITKTHTLQQQIHTLQQQLQASQNQAQQLQVQNSTLQQQVQQLQQQGNRSQPTTSTHAMVKGGLFPRRTETSQDRPDEEADIAQPLPHLPHAVPGPPATPIATRTSSSVAPTSTSSTSRAYPRNPLTSPIQVRRSYIPQDKDLSATPSAARTPRPDISARSRLGPSSARRIEHGHVRAQSEITPAGHPTPVTSRTSVPQTPAAPGSQRTSTGGESARERLREYQARRQARLQQQQTSTQQSPPSAQTQKSQPGAVRPHSSPTGMLVSTTTPTSVPSTSPAPAPVVTGARIQSTTEPTKLRHARQISQETLNAQAREEAYIAQLLKKQTRIHDASASSTTPNDLDPSQDAISFQAVIVTPARSSTSPSRIRGDTNLKSPVESTAPSQSPRVAMGALRSIERPRSPPVILPAGWDGGPPTYDDKLLSEENLGFAGSPRASGLVDDVIHPNTVDNVGESTRRASLPPEDITLLQKQVEIIDAEVVRALSNISNDATTPKASGQSAETQDSTLGNPETETETMVERAEATVVAHDSAAEPHSPTSEISLTLGADLGLDDLDDE